MVCRYPDPAELRPSGFTLIELSIVLVIIGLIIGGILAGQNLIATAAVRAQIAQIEKYNTAVNAFRGKYYGLPGDLAATPASQFGFVTSGCSTIGLRDGNGLIDGLPLHPLIQATGETGLFWQDLSTAGLIDASIPNSGAAPVVCGGASPALSAAMLGEYLPPAKLGSGNYLYVYENNGSNWYGLSTVTSVNTSGQLFSNAQLPVIQAYKLDAKIDDGLPQSGNVMAVYINGGYLAGMTTPAPNTTTSGGTVSSCYDTTSNTYSVTPNGGQGLNCALSFRFQ